MKYRDKETGEVVEAESFGHSLITWMENGWPRFLTPWDFFRRFEPVEDDG